MITSHNKTFQILPFNLHTHIFLITYNTHVGHFILGMHQNHRHVHAANERAGHQMNADGDSFQRSGTDTLV